MNIKEIDKWLDNEYGVSYTRLEELHDFFFEKYTNLNCILTELEEWLNHKHNDYKVLYKMYGNPYFMVEEYEKILKKVQDLKKKYKLGDKENEKTIDKRNKRNVSNDI